MISVQARPAGLLERVGLGPLMRRHEGRPDVVIGLLDGPVALDHPDLAGQRIHLAPGGLPGVCEDAHGVACRHGTFMAGILCARRGSAAPAICPGCTLLVRPIFAETDAKGGLLPSTTPSEVAAAIVACIERGARVLNVSAALSAPSTRRERELEEALDEAARRGVLVAAAAGNQGTLGSWSLTRHPWVIPVTACDQQGRPLQAANLGHVLGRRGLSVPGDCVTSLSPDGATATAGGTSVAAPFVTGAIALLWSAFPAASAGAVRRAFLETARPRRSVVPPVLDAWQASRLLTAKG